MASTRIIGDKAYPKTKPRIYNYDTSARVKKDVNVLSYYKKNQSKAEADVEEGKHWKLKSSSLNNYTLYQNHHNYLKKPIKMNDFQVSSWKK